MADGHEKHVDEQGAKKSRNAGFDSPAFQAHIFKPGQSGNPAGRPKRKSITEIYRKRGLEIITIDGVEMSREEHIVLRHYEMLHRTDIPPLMWLALLREFNNRHSGTAFPAVEGDNGGGNVAAEFVNTYRKIMGERLWEQLTDGTEVSES